MSRASSTASSAPMAPAVGGMVELVDGTGKLASASEMTSLLSGFAGKPINVVGVLGSKGSGKSTLLNNAFGTSFPIGGALGQGESTGVAAGACDRCLLLDCDGLEEGADPAATPKGTTAGQATALSAAVGDAFVVNLWRSDLGRSVASNVRTIKALLSEKLQEMDAEAPPEHRTPVLVVVHDCDPGADAAAVEGAVLEEIEAVWREVDRPIGALLEEYFAVQAMAIPHPRYHAVAYSAAMEALKSKVASMEASTATAVFRERVTKAWRAVQEAGSMMLPAKSELVAVYKVDSAYGDVMMKAEAQLKAWRQSVGSGRVVADFGKKSSTLYTSSLKAFDTKTVRFSTTSMRGTKRAALVALLETGIKELYSRQLTMLCADAEKSYKAELVKLLDNDTLDEDSEANVLRKTLFAFEADATELASEMLKLGFEDEYEELEADLQEFSEKFTDSPAAQAKAVAKVDTKVKKPKGERSVGFGLGLVGMVRQSGYGNLQGFAGYRAGPHTVTMGYANDASIPGAGPSLSKPPLLRLQPKLNLDIDL